MITQIRFNAEVKSPQFEMLVPHIKVFVALPFSTGDMFS